ncbi:16S rRNA (guanine(527)-N(7))-methyltransferase RsmG [Rhizorhabdus sp. FW153]|uniref:16S rRNA (guanine(527)-N(7))-methyltransferase RsmG n=1 Tax=Rhizorhabdus sp. FW153 TaxID=3400216 RepID=UPI003CF71289
MTEDDARAAIASTVPRETVEKLDQLIALVTDEMGRQNLIAASTVDHIWVRHILDSTQLLPLAPESASKWIDLGSGAGFPGMVIALLRDNMTVTLVESRRKRIDFLSFMAEQLGIADRVHVAGARLETLEPSPYDVISARAFAPLDRLLPLAQPFAGEETVWLLPKGRSAASELEAVTGTWQGEFSIVPSITDPEASIIVASKVSAARGASLKSKPRSKGRT